MAKLERIMKLHWDIKITKRKVLLHQFTGNKISEFVERDRLEGMLKTLNQLQIPN